MYLQLFAYIHAKLEELLRLPIVVQLLHSVQALPDGKPSLAIPEVILQSTFSRTVTSLSKQKRVNTHGHNSSTHYFDDETSGEFYS